MIIAYKVQRHLCSIRLSTHITNNNNIIIRLQINIMYSYQHIYCTCTVNGWMIRSKVIFALVALLSSTIRPSSSLSYSSKSFNMSMDVRQESIIASNVLTSTTPLLCFASSITSCNPRYTVLRGVLTSWDTYLTKLRLDCNFTCKHAVSIQ